jgi:hypothetical protein
VDRARYGFSGAQLDTIQLRRHHGGGVAVGLQREVVDERIRGDEESATTEACALGG